MKALFHVAAVALSIVIVSQSAYAAPKKVLFFTKSSGFEHDMIKEKNGEQSKAAKIMAELGAKNNIEFTFSKDGSLFTPESIAKFDAFCFYTTGDLTTPGTDKNPPMPKEGKAAFLEAIHNGKGFVGIHAGADTFHTHSDGWHSDGDNADPYIKMLGGEFIVHGSQQAAQQICVDHDFPGMSAVTNGFGPKEEWYSLKNFAPNLHVLLVQDTSGMTGNQYKRPNYPSTWAHTYGTGRVFYTSMGHRDDVWTNPVFQQVLAGGLKWATGQVDADVTPNLDKVTPEAGTLPPK